MPKPRFQWKTLFFCCSLALLLFTIAANGFLLWQYFVDVIIEHDSAAEILLAKQIAEEGRLVYSSRWYYSTELRTLHNQLVMTPLFYLINDMLFVNLLGSVITNILMAASAIASLKLLGVSTSPALLAGALVVTPFSYEVYYINTAGKYYSFFIITTLLFAALLLRLFHTTAKKRVYIIAAVCAALSFAQGLSGIRYLVILYAPLGILMLLLAIRRCDQLLLPSCANGQRPACDSFWQVFITFATCCAVYLAGLLLYLKVLKPFYGIHSAADSYVFSAPADIAQKLTGIFSTLLRVFSPLYSASLGSKLGVAELAGLACVLALFGCCVYLLLIHRRLPHLQRYWVAFAWLAFGFNAFVLIFTEDIYFGGSNITERFLLVGMFPMVTLPPMALGHAVGAKKSLLSPSWRAAVVLALTLSLVSNPVSLAGYCRSVANEGHRGHAVNQCTQFLLDNGYKNGFAIYTAQTMEVLSNGALHVTSLDYIDGEFQLHKWLRSHESMEIQYDDPRQFIVVRYTLYDFVDRYETVFTCGEYSVLEVSPEQIIQA